MFFESPFVVFMAKISSHIVRSVRLPEKRSVVAVAREALDHIEPSLARQRGSSSSVRGSR